MTPYLFGKYCLLERISVGGMAEVFRAKPLNAPEFNGYLALKRILPHLAEDDEFITMFVDEAKLTVQLNHPNIVRIYELGQFQTSYYILMEFIAGKDLLTLQKRVRKRREVIGVERSVFIAREMARGLDFAHHRADANGVPLNIIHRDVSPQNVLVDYLGNVKVIDFGIAKAASQSTRTQVGVLKGKMGYMSPEQVGGGQLDKRSDIFAIGTVLWEMLTNRRLFNADNEFETMQLVRGAKADPPSTFNPQVSPELDAIVMRALTASRDDRYQTAGQFADALDGYLARHPCDAEALSTWMREVFAEDLAEELGKREQFAAIQTPEDVRRLSAMAPKEESSAPKAPEETYEKTEIWAGEYPAPDTVDPMEFAAQHTVVQAGGFNIDEYLAAQRGIPLAQQPLGGDTPMAQRQSGQFAPMAYGGMQSAPMPAGFALDHGFKNEGTRPGVKKSNAGRTVGLVVAVTTLLALLMVAAYLGIKKFSPAKAVAGSVLITAVPETSQVRLNGQPFACTMPCRIENLGVGKHFIEVVEIGYKPHVAQVDVQADVVQPLDVVLVKDGPTMVKVATTFPDLNLRVFIDGEERRREELEPHFELPTGEHLLEVLADGHRPYKEFVEVKDQPLKFAPQLVPQAFEVQVKSEENSVVRLNGERVGIVPVKLKLDPYGLHEVEVTLRARGVSRWAGLLALPAIADSTLAVDFSKPPVSLKEKDFGYLSASTGDDWYAVWVNGIDTGVVTPIESTKRLPLVAGKHKVSFRRGYEQHDVEVEVRGGETVVLRESFDFKWDK